MPIYHWVCKKCGSQGDVIRSFDDYEIPPEEKLDGGCSDGPEHDWERHMGGGTTVIRSPYWGKKGYWIILVGFIAGSACLQQLGGIFS